jgi:regulator of protease activity HflC (stomatin/prohibitin superfamily)
MSAQSFVKSVFVLVSIISLSSCVVIREGQVGVKSKLGTFSERTIDNGVKFYNPLTSRVLKISTQTENLEVRLNIPSKEGLTILSEVSILYNIDGRKAPQLLREIGPNYEANIIIPVFRSAVSDVSARFFAKDMHTGERATIEKAIRDQMMQLMDGKGIEVEAVLLKSIRLPQSLANAIEAKLEAEQQAQQMEFVLQQAEREAEQKRVEAAGIRDAQIIISEGLDSKILQFKSIEAFKELANSPNAKIIVTDGDLPVLLEPNK